MDGGVPTKDRSAGGAIRPHIRFHVLNWPSKKTGDSEKLSGTPKSNAQTDYNWISPSKVDNFRPSVNVLIVPIRGITSRSPRWKDGHKSELCGRDDRRRLPGTDLNVLCIALWHYKRGWMPLYSNNTQFRRRMTILLWFQTIIIPKGISFSITYEMRMSWKQNVLGESFIFSQ